MCQHTAWPPAHAWHKSLLNAPDVSIAERSEAQLCLLLACRQKFTPVVCYYGCWA